MVANIPSGVGDRFIVPVSLRNQKRVFTSSNTYFHIIKYVHSFYYTHISVCHFVGVYVYAGAINRSPTAADRLPKQFKRAAITLQMTIKNKKGTWQKTTYLP